MSPVLTTPSIPMIPTPLFPLHAGFQMAMMAPVFPPCVSNLTDGISVYRHDNGYEPNERYPYHIVDRLLTGERFDAGDKEFRITKVKIHRVAHPIAGYGIGDVEMNSRLLLAPIASAVAALPFVGRGHGKEAKKVKDQADGAATEAMRIALNRRSIKGTIRGGEGGGRDGMARSGALYLGERVGTQYGLPIHFLVDPLEVTNATKALGGRLDTGGRRNFRTPQNGFPVIRGQAR